MRSATVIVLVATLVGCSTREIPEPPSPAALKEIIDPCLDRSRRLGPLIEAARSGTRDEVFARQSNDLTATCGAVRETLQSRAPESACMGVAQTMEGLGRELSAVFEARKDFDESNFSTVLSEAVAEGCASELPPRDPADASFDQQVEKHHDRLEAA